MSHSQFHCTARVYLDMHGLIFETSICYWQDQPGSRATGHARPDGPGPPPTSLSLSLSRSARLASGFPFLGGVGDGGRRGERLSAGRAALRRARPTTGDAPDPRGGPADLPHAGKERGPLRSFSGGALRALPREPDASARARRGAATAGADPPSGTGGEADGQADGRAGGRGKPRRRRRRHRRTC